MHPSGGYAAWCGWLDAFAAGADLDPAALCRVDDSLGPAMFGRLVDRINEAFLARVGGWNETLTRRLGAAVASGRGVREVGAVLFGARLALRPIFALADSPLLREGIGSGLRAALGEALASAQRGLEESVRQVPDRREELLMVIREQSLTRPALPAPAPAPSTRPPSPRSVIL
jgi:hypothetical protein